MKFFGVMFICSSITGFLTSWLFHDFFYSSQRTWFTKHRLAPSIGVFEMLLLSIVGRNLISKIDDKDTQEIRNALNALNGFGVVTSFGIGVLIADFVREL